MTSDSPATTPSDSPATTTSHWTSSILTSAHSPPQSSLPSFSLPFLPSLFHSYLLSSNPPATIEIRSLPPIPPPPPPLPLLSLIIMHSFTRYFSKSERTAHYKVMNQNSIKTDFRSLLVLRKEVDSLVERDLSGQLFPFHQQNQN